MTSKKKKKGRQERLRTLPRRRVPLELLGPEAQAASDEAARRRQQALAAGQVFGDFLSAAIFHASQKPALLSAHPLPHVAGCVCAVCLEKAARGSTFDASSPWDPFGLLVKDPAHPHLVGGEFQSDKYPQTPRGFVPLKVSDPDAQAPLYAYALAHRPRDPRFAADLIEALRRKGFRGALERPTWRAAFFSIEGLIVPGLAGWTDGQTWNGWACPLFEQGAADALVRVWVEAHGTFSGVSEGDSQPVERPSAWFDEETRSYGFYHHESDECDTYKRATGPHGVECWAIGAFAWAWQEAAEPPAAEPSEPSAPA
jgi:hypothetical protein